MIILYFHVEVICMESDSPHDNLFYFKKSLPYDGMNIFISKIKVKTSL